MYLSLIYGLISWPACFCFFSLCLYVEYADELSCLIQLINIIPNRASYLDLIVSFCALKGLNAISSFFLNTLDVVIGLPVNQVDLLSSQTNVLGFTLLCIVSWASQEMGSRDLSL